MNKVCLALWISLKDQLGLVIFCIFFASMYLPLREITHSIGFIAMTAVFVLSIFNEAIKAYELME